MRIGALEFVVRMLGGLDLSAFIAGVTCRSHTTPTPFALLKQWAVGNEYQTA